MLSGRELQRVLGLTILKSDKLDLRLWIGRCLSAGKEDRGAKQNDGECRYHDSHIAFLHNVLF